MNTKNKPKRFDLMNDIPELDYDTLNYIWDILWRFNHATKPTNNDKRSRIDERERIMDILQRLADENN